MRHTMRGLGHKAVVLFAALGLCGLAACTKSDQGSDQGSGREAGESSSGQKVTIGLVLDKGGKDDKSFNAAAVAGASRAKEEFGLVVRDVESPDDAAFEPALRTFAERGFPLVVAVGFAQADALKKVAPQFPQTHFAIVDAVVDAPNVASLMFNEHEGSFMVGYLAGLATKSGKVGFVGGMEVALIRRFLMAYEAGAREARSDIQVMNNFVGITAAAWANPARGKELALSQIRQGADVLFH
ncbi:MAG: BMP family ABC transporter substrate-binding protein, partial [Bdellovibrionales bacterium]|nr:BMP family ABC transporter substrate-binding protein [Bdellovibrionales bacterium]